MPPNGFLYVNDVPSASWITDPSPPVVAPVGDSGFDPGLLLLLLPGPALELDPDFFLMTVKKIGRKTARKMTMIAAAATPSHSNRRLRTGVATGFSDIAAPGLRGASDACRRSCSDRTGREGRAGVPGGSPV